MQNADNLARDSEASDGEHPSGAGPPVWVNWDSGVPVAVLTDALTTLRALAVPG